MIIALKLIPKCNICIISKYCDYKEVNSPKKKKEKKIKNFVLATLYMI